MSGPEGLLAQSQFFARVIHHILDSVLDTRPLDIMEIFARSDQSALTKHQINDSKMVNSVIGAKEVWEEVIQVVDNTADENQVALTPRNLLNYLMAAIQRNQLQSPGLPTPA